MKVTQYRCDICGAVVKTELNFHLITISSSAEYLGQARIEKVWELCPSCRSFAAVVLVTAQENGGFNA